MNRLPVAERREQLIDAALTVASRDGIDAATVRAVAAEAGVSLGVVHYCFQDKAELMRAMAHAITTQNQPGGLDGVPVGTDVASVISAAVSSMWEAISESRGPQLLSYELTTSSLRHAELKQVAIEQYRGYWAAAEHVLEEAARVARVRWLHPVPEIARAVIAVVDGYSLAWLVDGDSDVARNGLLGFASFLTQLTEPLPDEPVADASADASVTVGADAGASGDPA